MVSRFWKYMKNIRNILTDEEQSKYTEIRSHQIYFLFFGFCAKNVGASKWFKNVNFFSFFKWHLYILPGDFLCGPTHYAILGTLLIEPVWMYLSFFFLFLFVCHFWWAKRIILCGKYISYIFHVITLL
jgi:hypothetical protein